MEQKKPRKIVKCPICRNPSSTDDFPFCSNRCRQVDLHRWFSGHYVIPGEENEFIRDEEEVRVPPKQEED